MIETANAAGLPACGSIDKCPKCTGQNLAVHWCRGCKSDIYTNTLHPYNLRGEHLHRTCMSCSYKWFERTQDTPAGTAAVTHTGLA